MTAADRFKVNKFLPTKGHCAVGFRAIIAKCEEGGL
jgi:hypothetical protein